MRNRGSAFGAESSGWLQGTALKLRRLRSDKKYGANDERLSDGTDEIASKSYRYVYIYIYVYTILYGAYDAKMAS